MQGADEAPPPPARAEAVEPRHGDGDGAHVSSLRRISRAVTSTSTNEMPNISVATAAASCGRNWFASWKMKTGAVSVLPG